jgi:hypothetical protein
LIPKEFHAWTFFAAKRQALDFSGLAQPSSPDFNKVIHMSRSPAAKQRQIKHLGGIPEARPKVRSR